MHFSDPTECGKVHFDSFLHCKKVYVVSFFQLPGRKTGPGFCTDLEFSLGITAIGNNSRKSMEKGTSNLAYVNFRVPSFPERES